MLAVDVLSKKLQHQTLEDQQSVHQGTQVWKVSVNSQAYKSLVAKNKSQNKTTDSKYVGGAQNDSTLGNILHTPTTPPKKRHCRFQSATETENLKSFTGGNDVTPCSVGLEDYSLIKPLAVIPNRSWTPEGSNSDLRVYDVCDRRNSSEHLCITPRSNYQELGYSGPCEFETPPESPVPRPSSASTCSLRHDGAFTLLGAPWLDNNNTQSDFQSRLFKNRSLSFEEEILSTPITSGFQSNIQASPQRKIPRCRSQPSFIHDRKYGIKRRRNERPTLNFQKMTKTAYIPISSMDSTDRTEYCQKRPCRFRKELDSVMGLMPIASSPMDSDSVLLKHKHSSEMDEGYGRDLQGPVKLIGEDDFDNSFCNDDEKEQGVFYLQEELDIEQIENH